MERVPPVENVDAPSPMLTSELDRESIVEAIITTVAEEKGVDPFDLRPLYDTLDPDALSRLIEQGANGRVVFTYEGCEVEVTMDDPVTVHAAQHEPRYTEEERHAHRP